MKCGLATKSSTKEVSHDRPVSYNGQRLRDPVLPALAPQKPRRPPSNQTRRRTPGFWMRMYACIDLPYSPENLSIQDMGTNMSATLV